MLILDKFLGIVKFQMKNKVIILLEKFHLVATIRNEGAP